MDTSPTIFFDEANFFDKIYLNAIFNEAALMAAGLFIFQLLLILIIGLFCIKLSKKLINRFFDTQKEKMSERKINTISSILIKFSKYFIYFIMITQILPLFGLDMTTILTVAGVGSVAIGFGAQGVVKDFITGMLIIIEDQFGVGDTVTIGGFTGTVENIGIRTTILRNQDGAVHIIPNSSISSVTNENK